MFKFFRLYNKVILVVGGCVLMVAFLIPQAVTMFHPSPANEEIGSINGETVTLGDRNLAANQLALLEQINLAQAGVTNDPLTWLMIQRDARRLGLWASDSEVGLLLRMMGIDDEVLQQMARQAGTTAGYIRETARQWLVAEQYRTLVTGKRFVDELTFSPSLGIRRFEYLLAANQYAQQGNAMNAQIMMAMAQGTYRQSGSLQRHFVQDSFAKMGGRMLLLKPDVEAAPEPDDATVMEVFEHYKDDLPGTGEPFPFGYKYPDRVRLTWLTVPEDAVRDAVDIAFIDVMDEYNRKKSEFAEEGKPAPDRPTSQTIELLTDELTDRAAARLNDKVVARIQSLLAESTRGIEKQDDYLVLPEGFTPLPFESIAQTIKDETGVEVQLDQAVDDWVPVSELMSLPQIGFSVVNGNNRLGFAQYVGIARELVDDPTAVPRSLRLQVGQASLPLKSQFDGTTYFFRLTAAQKSHTPESLDEVREQVVEDAKTIAAFEHLADQADAWRHRVVDEGFAAAAEAAETDPIDVLPFQGVIPGEQGVPYVNDEVGQSREFVDAAFKIVDKLGPDPDVQQLPLADRVTVTPLPAAPEGPALAIFVAETYEPLTRSGFDQQIQQMAPLSISFALQEPAVDPLDYPLSKQAMAKRVGFDLAAFEGE